MRYEWSAMLRRMLPLYASVIVVSLLNAVFWHGNLSRMLEGSVLFTLPVFQQIGAFLQIFLGFLYFAVLMGLFFVTLWVIVQRFYQGLLREEGYLMFTLPVKPWQLAASKAVVSLVTATLSGFIGLMAICILIAYDGQNLFQYLLAIPNGISALYQAVASELPPETRPQLFLIGAELVALYGIVGLSIIYHFYAAMSLGQLSKSHRVAWSVIWYLLIYMVSGIAGWLVIGLIVSLPAMVAGNAAIEAFLRQGSGILAVHFVLGLLLACELLELVVKGAITHYILTYRLNLE